MAFIVPHAQSLDLGVVIRKSPGVTRWAKWVWRVVAVLPGAGPANWKLMRSEGDVQEFHAATRTLWLYPSDTEAYVHELQTRSPSVYVILRNQDISQDTALDVVCVTASPYEAQDYADSGEEIIEKIPMSPMLHDWVVAFVNQHHVEEPFVKRRRDKTRTDRVENGIGDARISQVSDVYRAPTTHAREAGE